MVYEDFVDAYEETVLQILDYLHIPTPEKLALGEKHALKKQANEQSEEWLQRYYQFKQLDRQDINTVQENAAQRYIQANVLPRNLGEVNWQGKPLPFKLYRNCEQIPLSLDVGIGSAQGTGAVQGTMSTAPVRNDVGGEHLSDGDYGDSALRPLGSLYGLGWGQIGQMLVDIYGLTRQSHSVPMFHPMLQYIPKEETGALPFYTSLLRPVPSGGALFPCELYLLVADGADRGCRDSALRPLEGPYDGQEQYLPAGIYHYDVAHHALDILKQGDYSSLLQAVLAHPGDTPPPYTLLLSSFFWKDGFKYGAFSYRLQGLDIGTVISQSEIITHHAGLSTTIHYQFQDKALNDLLGLDPLHESVYAIVEWRQKTVGVDPASTDETSSVVDESPINVGDVWSVKNVKIDECVKSAQGAGSAQGTTPTVVALGTINASALATNEIPSRPMTESIACWPLPEEVHRASLIETREAFRPLHSLAPIQPQYSSGKTLSLSAEMPLDLWEARYKRRSIDGTFLPTPLTQEQLSQLLLMSMRGTTNDLDGHSSFLQHTQLYCVVKRVAGIPAGVYRYMAEKHKLELVRAGVLPYDLFKVRNVPQFNLFYMSVSLFPVGDYKSGFQVYGDRWYRMQNMEAGIITQRLYLAAAALKLGCRASLGFSVLETNRFLGLLDAKDDLNNYQYMSLMQIMIGPERSAYQHYEQSLLI